MPVELERVINRTLEKDRELRYQTASDLRSDLERVRRNRMTVLPAPSLGDPAARSPRRRVLAVGALLAAVALGVAGIAYRFVTPASVITSLAVLPFAHEGSDPNTEYLSTGMTESLINSLSQSASILVLSRNAVAAFKGRDVDPQVAGRELQVDG